MALVAAAPAPTPAPAPEDEPCGWGPLQPSCLQPLRTPPLALAAFCSASFIQGLTVNGYVNVVLPTLEKRFQLRSVQAGTIVSMYNVGSLLCSTPVAYFGGSSHKPRIIAIGTLVMASGSMLFSLPHFLAPSYHSRPDVRDTCPNLLTAHALCRQNEEAGLANYRYLFMLGNFLHGCGASPFYTLGVAYIDDSVPTKTSPVYLGIYFAMAILGPAVGFISGGYFLSLYTDVQKASSEIKLNRFSKVWVGAWWIGFVIAACLGALVAIPIFAFPKELPGSQEIRASKRPEMDEFAATKLRVEKPTKFIPMVSLLLTNRTYVLLTIAGTIETLMASGISAFITKILESQFGLTSSASATLLGLIAMPSACGGTLLGGYLIDKLDLVCANIIRMCVLASMFTWMLMGFVLFHCPNAPYAGATFTGGYNFNPNATCNAQCKCSELLYSPICGVDNVTYFSPCFAGCRQEMIAAGTVLYTDCECIHSKEQRTGMQAPVQAELKRCQTACDRLPIFSVGLFLVLFGTFLNSAPGLSASIRVVGDTAKPLALGLQWVSVRLFGTIMAPILFGMIIDRSCLTWQHLCGEQRGACIIYENSSMSYNLFGVLIFVKTLSVLFFFTAWITYHPASSFENR
ncbi:solute carrier organic anion transporter family member 4A1 [Rhipicephalus sanguineus]|uniref:solute carrier organic anion transporter family member 4A1 n=1 Tax=Rhipicephalus sanguineus TaxID=34632 RepID=UPI0018948D11|nr:solute carrier organic anion transporter family member 4A1 [Rhipicephalus sanguineus]